MKKIVILGLVAIMSSQMMGASAQSLLKKVRDDYYKEQAAKEKAERAARTQERASKTRTRTQNETADLTDVENVDVEVVGSDEYPTLERVKEEKPKNAMERLERTSEKAAIKVDYYERVVRSVAREETELKDYNDVIQNKKSKHKKVPKVTGLGK